MVAIPQVISQHCEESSFLWFLRDHAVGQPHYTLTDLAKLDGRIEAHLDGLRVSGDLAWEICKESLVLKGAAEIFPAAILAFENGTISRLNAIFDAENKSAELSRCLVSALAWSPYLRVETYVHSLLGSELPGLRRIGIAACAVHRQDLGRALVDALADNNSLLRARALKAAGELGRKDLFQTVAERLRDEEQKCRFYAAWSAALLGSSAGVSVLRDVVQSGGSYSERACSMALKRMGIPDGHPWIRELANDPGLQRLGVIGAGALGDPAAVPWLIEHMAVPRLARVAGESFTMITGVDIAYEDLDGEWPEGFEAGPTENPDDEDVALDPDEDLPWPNPELIDQWWSKNKSGFRNGIRYLLGKPISVEQCQHVLRYGYQRQRAAAAIELAMLQPGQPLFEIRAPGFRQKQLLGVK
jgi:uncharacterized protein (TIGR02270 family)